AAACASSSAITDVPLLTPDEERAALAASRGPAAGRAPPSALEAFERIASEEPERVAVTWSSAGGGSMAYGELDARAARLAHALLDAGVAPEERVGVCAHRGWHALAAVLALAKAGATIVALDPTYPKKRLAAMTRDARVGRVLGHEELRDRVPE